MNGEVLPIWLFSSYKLRVRKHTFFMLLSDFHISYLLSLEYKAFDSQHINRQFIGILNKYFKHI